MSKKPVKDKYNFALYVPIIKYKDWEELDRKVKLNLHLKDPVRRFAAWLTKKPLTYDITFDEMSSLTWLLVDGRRTIFEISKLVNKDNKDTMEESLRRVVIFFRYLAKKGWITFIEVLK